MSGRPKALIAWSGGKDCAYALHVVREAGEVEIVGALTTLTDPFDRVSVHGVRADLLRMQLAAAGLPATIVRIPYPCPNDAYEQAMAAAMVQARAEGISHVVFGDLYLADIRAYREAKLAGSGIAPLFPLWGRPTGALAREMIAAGLQATVVAVDPNRVPRAIAGRRFDAALLADLPHGVDPCGENGEFHSFVTAGPMLARHVVVRSGETVERDGQVYVDLLAA